MVPSGTGPGQIQFSFGLELNSLGQIYVMEVIDGRLQRFDSAGNLLDLWQAIGAAPGQWQAGVGTIDIDANDDVYLADSQNYRVSRYDADMNFDLSVGSLGSGNGQFQAVQAVAAVAAAVLTRVPPGGDVAWRLAGNGSGGGVGRRALVLSS